MIPYFLDPIIAICFTCYLDISDSYRFGFGTAQLADFALRRWATATDQARITNRVMRTAKGTARKRLGVQHTVL
jgi:hypothetical protein